MRIRFLVILLSCAAASGGCLKNPPANDAETKQKIQQVLDRWERAFEAKDLAGVMSVYAPGDALVAYDVVPPLQYKGAAAYRKDYADFFAQVDGPLKVEDVDEHVMVSRDLALAYGLEHLTGRLKDGTPLDTWLRYSDGLRRINDRWLVVHEHVSVPADLATGKARLDLKP
jgi:ketosteroid isomerase-like protein